MAAMSVCIERSTSQEDLFGIASLRECIERLAVHRTILFCTGGLLEGVH